MAPADESTARFNHGFTLLRELNSQRGMGQFCDCVLQLHTHPGRLFLAHKSVLAAFSPVLASLLPHHGSLVDLNLPHLTPETLDILLDYIYTGTLPPQSQEEPVLAAAIHLQMEQLQQALRCRRTALAETVQDELSRKRRFVERQSLDEASLASPSYYPYGPDQPSSSSPSCEVVPVICRVGTSGNNGSKFPLQARCRTRDMESTGKVSDTSKPSEEPSRYGHSQPSHRLDSNSVLDWLFEPAQSEQDKPLVGLLESSLDDLPGVVGEQVDSRFRSSFDSGELQSTLPDDVSQTMTVLRSKADGGKDRWTHSAHSVSKDLSPETECSPDSIHASRCVSGEDSVQSTNPFDSGAGEHLAEIFGGKNSYATGGNLLGDTSRPDGQAPLCLDSSSIPDTNEPTRERRTSGPDARHEIAQRYPRHTEPAAIEGEPQRTDFAESYEFTQTRTYRGHLHYQCLLEHCHSKLDSSDSDSDRGYPVSNTEANESSTDITELSLPTRRPSRSPGEHSVTHPFQCSMCERAFSQRGSLNRHMRSHLGVRPYSCPQCSMTFSRQYRVTEHMRVHQRSCEGPAEGHLRTASTGMDV